MTRRLLLFEDAFWRDLRPLTELLPVPALVFGASTLAGRWLRAAPFPLAGVQARPLALGAWFDAPAPVPLEPADEIVAVNAAALPGAWLTRVLEADGPGLWTAGERVAAARAPAQRLSPGFGRGEGFEAFLRGLGLPEARAGATFLRWPWDFVERNPEALREDLYELSASQAGSVHAAAVLLDPARIRIEAGARIDPLAVLDARSGPIHIGAEAIVTAHTVVTGPCVVGAGTELLGGAVGHSTIGPHCRLAGEVDASLWQGWSNKRHHGFVGHSVIGPWCNLGALTTTSDLKNNYGPVRVTVGGHERDSGLAKVGSFLGAHAKTGIGSLLATGAVVGTGANLFGGGRFAPKAVPPFAWWDGETMREHQFDRFLETARTAHARRGRTLGAGEEAALRGLFESTADERRRS